ncbi:P-loop containing nucleoside triphosphate hydrolase protein [Cladochytrium replicatum]|nr:P-loop containing nucleoside triphosphate hydrolase protein [Cladochytrium replicatum]
MAALVQRHRSASRLQYTTGFPLKHRTALDLGQKQNTWKCHECLKLHASKRFYSSPAPKTPPPFRAYGVSDPLSAALSTRFNINQPSECQKALIPTILAQDRDLFLRDLTGLGKTLGLVVALLSKRHPTPTLDVHKFSLQDILGDTKPTQRRYRNKDCLSPTNLVLLPTRELALQFHGWLVDLLKTAYPDRDYASQFLCVVAGTFGESTKEFRKAKSMYNLPQPVIMSIQNLRTKKNISTLIGTPNHIQKLYEFNVFDPNSLETLILDEVDQLIEPWNKYATVKERHNRIVHPLPAEVLLDQIVSRRRKDRAKVADGTKEGKDRGVIPDLRIVATSATINAGLRFEVTKRRGWMKDPIFLDICGRPTPAPSLHHYGILVTPDTGTLTDLYPTTIKGGDFNMDDLPDHPISENPNNLDYNALLEVVSKIMESDKVDRALLFTHSSAPLTSIVEQLESFGVQSARLMDRFIRAQEIETPTQPTPTTSSNDPFESENGPVNLLVGHENQVYGIDLPTISHVFILGAPSSEQAYLHLAGRAGRYGKEGRVYTLLDTRVHARKLRSMSRAIDFQFEKLPFEV